MRSFISVWYYQEIEPKLPNKKPVFHAIFMNLLGQNAILVTIHGFLIFIFIF